MSTSCCVRPILVFVLALAPSVAHAAGLSDFGRCLAREGAVFYGASWCPYCKAQRQTLGAAMSHVRYVECAEDGSRETTADACSTAGVGSYPTWVFADGSRLSGHQSLSALAARTGCSLPSGSGGAKTPPAAAAKPGGPKIIEVPH